MKLRLLYIVGISMLANQLCAAIPMLPEIKSKSALKAFNAGQFSQAKELYSEALKDSNKQLAPALNYNIATSSSRMGETTQPISQYMQVYDPKNHILNANAMFNAGVSLATSESQTIHRSLDEAKAILNDKSIQALANATSETKMQQLQQLQQSSAAVQKALSAVTSSQESNRKIAELWRHSLIENSRDTDAKHNAEITQLIESELNKDKEELEMLLAMLQPPPQTNQDEDDQQEQQKDQNQNEDNKNDENQKNDNSQDQNKQQDQDKEKQADQKNNDDKSETNKQDQQQQEEKKNEADRAEQDEKQQEESENKEKQSDNNSMKNASPANNKSQQHEQVKIGEMSKQDVQRLLNALPDDKTDVMQRLLNVYKSSSQEPEKDW